MDEILEYLKKLSRNHDEESAKEWIKIVESLQDDMEISDDWKDYTDMMIQRIIFNCNTTKFNAYIYKELNGIDQCISIGGVDTET